MTEERKDENQNKKSEEIHLNIMLLEYLDTTIRHIQTVQQNCIILGKKLISDGDFRLGKMLIYNGFQHDVSKFIGIEWDYLPLGLEKKLNKDKRANFLNALKQHQESNQHHAEYWDDIQHMPDVYLAEMVCDWKARSSEFGTDLRKWIDDEAIEKYCFKKNDEIYLKIMRYVDLLCGEAFTEVKP